MAEKVEKRGAERSNFSVTWRMLSQYMKEKRGFVGVGLEMPPTGPVEHRRDKGDKDTTRTPAAKTMSLLPGADVSPDEDNAGDAAGAGRCLPEPMDLFPQQAGFESAKAPDQIKDDDSTYKSQLTIFYNGRVLVWDDFPADKARDLMQMAVKENAAALRGGDNVPTAPAVALPSASASDMPLMRRSSLHRFLEKRKDRISTKAPYQIHDDSSNVTRAVSKFWLGLGGENIISSRVN